MLCFLFTLWFMDCSKDATGGREWSLTGRGGMSVIAEGNVGYRLWYHVFGVVRVGRTAQVRIVDQERLLRGERRFSCLVVRVRPSACKFISGVSFSLAHGHRYPSVPSYASQFFSSCFVSFHYVKAAKYSNSSRRHDPIHSQSVSNQTIRSSKGEAFLDSTSRMALLRSRCKLAQHSYTQYHD